MAFPASRYSQYVGCLTCPGCVSSACGRRAEDPQKPTGGSVADELALFEDQLRKSTCGDYAVEHTENILRITQIILASPHLSCGGTPF